MWVLVLIVCGATCQMETVIGTYSKKETCEEAASIFSDGDANYRPFRRSAYCIPAPDDIVYE